MTKKSLNLSSLNNQISRRDFLIGMGLITGGALLAGCKPMSSAVESTEEVKEIATVRAQANWIKQVQYNGFYAAILKGFYEKEGINGDLLAGGPGIVSMRVLDAKQCEVALVGSIDAYINSFVGGAKLRMIGATFQRSPAGLIYLADNPIETPQDAVGKRIGLQEGATQAWQVVCAKNGLNMETDMEIITVGYDPTPLIDGTVDGYWGYATSQTGVIRAQGYEVGVLDPWIWGNRSYGNIMIVREDDLQENLDVLVRWLRATVQGHVYANKHIDELVKYTVDTYGEEYGLDFDQQLDEATAQVEYLESDLTKEKGLFWFDKAVLQENLDTLVSLGEIEADVAPTPDEISSFEVLEGVFKDGVDAVNKPALEM